MKTMQSNLNRRAPTPRTSTPKIAARTTGRIATGTAALTAALLLLAALAPAPQALARDPQVTLPGLIPAAESGPIEHVQTLQISIASDSPALARAVQQSLTDQLKTIRLDGAELFRIVDEGAPHRLAGSARVQKSRKEIRDRQIVTDYNNCLAHTSRTTTAAGSRGQNTTTTTETCSQWGTREVIRECVVDMQTYSGRLRLTDTGSDALVYSRVFARAVQPNACGELMQMTPAEFAEEFAR
ncbi:MAG: hypothetical protein ISN29_12490, partial [Gammaproteobacteria bacterium AqS3]|nr:hypothetical protein [Gammaproteobacteria bacterium AqS3]